MNPDYEKYLNLLRRLCVLLVGIVCEVSALKVWGIYAAILTSFRRWETTDFTPFQHLGSSDATAHNVSIVLAVCGSLLGWLDAASKPRIPGILVGVSGLAIVLDVLSII